MDELGPLIGEVTLKPGDVLYLPRGIVHQATCSGSASLHVTASVGRQHAWRDLIEVGVLGALEAAASNFPEWRETLPADLTRHMGIANADDDEEEDEGIDDDDEEEEEEEGADRGNGGRGDNGQGSSSSSSGFSGGPDRARRAAISMRLRTMLRQLVDSMPLDDMVDQFVCQRFMYDRMPPRLAAPDAARRVTDPEKLDLDSKIRKPAVTNRCPKGIEGHSTPPLLTCARCGSLLPLTASGSTPSIRFDVGTRRAPGH